NYIEAGSTPPKPTPGRRGPHRPMPLPWFGREFNPDWPDHHFHRSAAFLSLPRRSRWECLRRNPRVPQLLADAIAAAQLGQTVRNGKGQAPEDDPVIMQGKESADELRERYWIWVWFSDPTGEHLVPPGVEIGPSWMEDDNPWNLT